MLAIIALISFLKTRFLSVSSFISFCQLAIFASSTTYSDGTVIFYCHAEESDKKILDDIYTVCERQLERDEFSDIFKYSTDYVQLLRSSNTITAISFNGVLYLLITSKLAPVAYLIAKSS